MIWIVCAGPEGEQRVRTLPLKNHKNIGFLSNTGPTIPKNHKAIEPAFHVGPSFSGTPAKRHLDGVLLAGQGWPAYRGICTLSSQLKEKKHTKKNVVSVGPPLVKIFWIRAWIGPVSSWENLSSGFTRLQGISGRICNNKESNLL